MNINKKFPNNPNASKTNRNITRYCLIWAGVSSHGNPLEFVLLCAVKFNESPNAVITLLRKFVDGGVVMMIFHYFFNIHFNFKLIMLLIMIKKNYFRNFKLILLLLLLRWIVIHCRVNINYTKLFQCSQAQNNNNSSYAIDLRNSLRSAVGCGGCWA